MDRRQRHPRRGCRWRRPRRPLPLEVVDPLRGEVYDCRFPSPIGVHPGVVLTSSPLIQRFASVIVVLITGTAGPRPLRVPVGPDAGSTRDAKSFVDVTSVFTVAIAQLRRRRGRLSGRELAAVERGLATVLGLDPTDPG